MTKTCVQCNQPYEAIKATSRYCSAKCRVAANRAGSVTVTPLSVTPEPSGSVTQADPVTLRHADPVSVTLDDCLHVQQAAGSTSHNTVNTYQWLSAGQLPPHTVNRVSLPGDADYNGVATW